MNWSTNGGSMNWSTNGGSMNWSTNGGSTGAVDVGLPYDEGDALAALDEYLAMWGAAGRQAVRKKAQTLRTSSPTKPPPRRSVRPPPEFFGPVYGPPAPPPRRVRLADLTDDEISRLTPEARKFIELIHEA